MCCSRVGPRWLGLGLLGLGWPGLGWSVLAWASTPFMTLRNAGPPVQVAQPAKSMAGPVRSATKIVDRAGIFSSNEVGCHEKRAVTSLTRRLGESNVSPSL